MTAAAGRTKNEKTKYENVRRSLGLCVQFSAQTPLALVLGKEGNRNDARTAS